MTKDVKLLKYICNVINNNENVLNLPEYLLTLSNINGFKHLWREINL